MAGWDEPHVAGSRLRLRIRLLYASDPVLQGDERNRARYAAHTLRFGTTYGIFTTDVGAVFRHHDISHLPSLLAGFDLLAEQRVDIPTMNGHPSEVAQLLARKR